MYSYGLPILVTLFAWWFSTGAILYLDGLPRRTFVWSMVGASVIAVLGLFGLWATRADMSVSGAYLAFFSALALWGWNEIAFLLGHVTGPRRSACPDGARGVKRFIYASQSVLYHEALILLTLGAIALAIGEGANRTGLYAFALLWAMRLSTKLNVFLGVPNLTVDFLPDHLRYLKSFFAIKPMNLLFPFSVSTATLLTAYLGWMAAQAPLDSSTAIGITLLASLSALALIEHWFLVLPLPFGELWRWGMGSRPKRQQELAAESGIGLLVVDGATSEYLASITSLPLKKTDQPSRLEQDVHSQGQSESWPRRVIAGGAVG